MAIIKLINVNDILNSKMSFFIPDYQRGYRWGQQQVEDLLSDLEEFYNEYKGNDKIVYCIQPLVVNKSDNTTEIYNVIDGQQRLTTVKILLSCLGEKDTYFIKYQTRKGSDLFLDTISEQNDACAEWKSNADYYHMFNAKKAITRWLEKQRGEGFKKEEFSTMIKDKVNFVWYESDEKEPIKVFTRLNIGKIGLTESELIKALFLSSNNFTSNTTTEDELLTLVEIANEWDKIEYRLQDDRFWLFFHSTEYGKPTRIDYILDIVREMNTQKKDQDHRDIHPTFRYFYEKFKEANKEANNKQKYLTTQWAEISRIYQIIEEWYNDEELYHYIGYLCALESDEVYRLLRIYEGREKAKLQKDQSKKKIESKQEFIRYLKGRIKERCGDMDLNSKYEDENPSKTDVKPILLLHSVQTVLNQNASITAENKYSLPDFARFPFHLFKKEGWDVEHIRPNSLEKYEGDRKKTARQKYVYVLSQYQDTEVEKAINKYNNSDKSEEEAFNELWEAINVNNENNKKNNELSEAQKNQIWNYVLLDASTNREYGNSCFAIKREYVLKKEKGIKPEIKIENNQPEPHEKKEAAFVPIGTKNVFSKAYTDYPDNLKYWTEKDAAYYRMDIEKTLWWCLFDETPQELLDEEKREKRFKDYKNITIDEGNYEITFKAWYEKEGKKSNE